MININYICLPNNYSVGMYSSYFLLPIGSIIEINGTRYRIERYYSLAGSNQVTCYLDTRWEVVV